MYSVKVYSYSGYNRVVIAEAQFLFGQWAEIGFWLDKNYYNSGKYYVEIDFIEA